MGDVRQMVAIGVIKAMEKKAATGSKVNKLVTSDPSRPGASQEKPHLGESGSRRSLGVALVLPELS